MAAASSRRIVGVAVGAAVLAVALTVGWLLRSGPAAPATKRYVGRATCAECHAEQSRAFAGSHHDLAMQDATSETVLGDFGGATFEHFGVTTTFSKQGDRFTVRTDGPDGQLHDYEVAYVFGVTPLQQYLIDIGGGRLQSLTIAWDSRPREQGGQRWFHLYPDERTPAGDELHWAGIQQNWNFMCAECHSTDLRRGYDEAADRYHTSWSELDVSCEACHGPASEHVAWARGDRAHGHLGDEPGKGLVVSFDERRGVTWLRDPETRLPRRSTPRATQKELDTCARCHSRRTVFEERFVPGQPLLDTHLPELLTEPLFHADGQMRDEVYNYQSFLQSRMAQHGVTCSDCHEVHSGALRGTGNSVCMQCHEAVLDTKAHHFHEPGSEAAQCVACHAPTVTYMGVDPRHDHGFRIPRPDLAARYGTPDACTGCHTDRQPAWAADALRTWYGRVRTDRSTWTEAFAAGRRGSADAAAKLLGIARDEDLPDIVRATALRELPRPIDATSAPAVLTALRDDNALLRWTAAEILADSPLELRAPLPTLLGDPVRAVRMAAARGLAEVDATRLSAPESAALQRGLAEFVAAQRVNSDRPEGRLNLGNLRVAQGDLAAAEREFRAAIHLHPQFVPAYVNLADLHRAAGREAECERVLRDALRAAPGNAEVSHALGLSLVRQRRIEEAVAALGDAAAAAPEQVRHAFVYAVALQSAGRLDDAVAVLEAANARRPNDPDVIELLVEYLAERGDLVGARAMAAQFEARWPRDERVRRWRQAGLLR